MFVAPAIGIDVGTSNCLVAVFRQKRVEILENLYGSRLTPSFVTILHNKRLVGQTAKDSITKHASNTIYGKVKLLGSLALNIFS